MRRTRIIAASASLALLLAAAAVPASAGQPQNKGCWGSASAAMARAGETGAHSSSFDSPRLGLGNVARLLTDSGNPNDLPPALTGDAGICS